MQRSISRGRVRAVTAVSPRPKQEMRVAAAACMALHMEEPPEGVGWVGGGGWGWEAWGTARGQLASAAAAGLRSQAARDSRPEARPPLRTALVDVVEDGGGLGVLLGGRAVPALQGGLQALPGAGSIAQVFRRQPVEGLQVGRRGRGGHAG